MSVRKIPEGCAACGSLKRMSRDDIADWLDDFSDWSLSDSDDRIRSIFEFVGFLEAIDFLNRLAEIAEREQHHPEFHLTGYRHVSIEFHTFSSGGVTMNDLTMAKLTNELYAEMQEG